METSETIVEIAKALSVFQSECPNPKLDGVNPHFSSKFSTLSEIIKTITPTLTKNGLSLMQPTKTEGNQVGVSTLLLHSSGQFLQSDYIWIPLAKANAQGVGAAITYGRRFSLGATLGIATESDDDGNSISGQNKSGQQQSQPQNKPQQNNNNTPKPISDKQKPMLNGKLTELVKLYASDGVEREKPVTRESLLTQLESVKDIGKFGGSTSNMTAGQASKAINQLDKWITNKKPQEG